MQILHEKELFDNYNNADEVLKDFLATTRRPDLEKIQDNEIQWSCS